MEKDKKQKDIIPVLEEIKAGEKAKAKLKGSWPQDKIIEECCEVLIDHINDKDTGEEEVDLLMCLVSKWFCDPEQIEKWFQKLLSRGRLPTGAQQAFYDAHVSARAPLAKDISG